MEDQFTKYPPDYLGELVEMFCGGKVEELEAEEKQTLANLAYWIYSILG